MSRYQHIEVKPITGALGAQVSGVRLSQDLTEFAFAEIHQAFLAHLVLFFRDQHLSIEELKAFAGRFGKLHIHPYTKSIPEHPEVLEIVKTEDERHNWGDGWHSDMSAFERPTLGAVLQASEVPDIGGDTQWANMYLAYETLSNRMKALVCGLRAVYSNDPGNYVNFNGMQTIPGEVSWAEHPFIRTHPETARRSLFYGRRKINCFHGMTHAESTPLLEMLHNHAENPDFTCRIRWTPGAVAIWDNRCTIHRATADYFSSTGEKSSGRRVMHRLSIEGDKPIFVPAVGSG